MAGRNPVTLGKAKGKGKATASRRNAVPDVFQEMLAEALPTQVDVAERPLKRRRTGRRDDPVSSKNATSSPLPDPEDDDEDLEFEDVLSPIENQDSENGSLFAKNEEYLQQTAYRDSGDDSDEDSVDWEPVEFESNTPVEPSGDLELTLSTKSIPQRRAPAPRRKAITKEDRALRLQIHKLHILCLLSYVDRRNNWCNDYEVQILLKPLLSKKMVTYLKPASTLSQFGQTESLKRGLDDVARMWRSKFSITMRGIRRALWADNEENLRNVGQFLRILSTVTNLHSLIFLLMRMPAWISQISRQPPKN